MSQPNPYALNALLNGATPGGVGLVTEDAVFNYVSECWSSFVTNWLGRVPEPQHTGPQLTRLSTIGKPVWLQALRLDHIRTELEEQYGWGEALVKDPPGTWVNQDCVMHRRFHFGHTLEAEAILLLLAHGLEVTDTQTQVVFNEEHNVRGHCDGVITLGDKRYVFDVKTMSAWSFDEYVKNPHDNSGYLTQIACYQHCLGTDGAFLLCYNKNTHEFRVVEPEQEHLDRLVKRAHRVVDLLAGVHTVKDVDTLPKPPALQATWYNKEVPGVWVPHPSMQWEPERVLLWDIAKERINPRSKPRECVLAHYDTIEQAILKQTTYDNGEL